ncbi:MAG: FAD:protein FMN transferase [Patescibacteria group bacterium]|nr:FAD:protein FMN transferase [Patescibacteria group bacterium]
MAVILQKRLPVQAGKAFPVSNGMKQTKILMGMPITVEIADKNAMPENLEKIFSYFKYVDEKFSTYKESSEITKINKGKFSENGWSEDMKEVFRLAEITKKETCGYFDIWNGKKYDPSGLVKGWAVYNAAKILKTDGFSNFYINAGGDIETRGKNTEGKDWVIGIKNPFNAREIIKTLRLKNKGIATSGTYIRGQHIYNPKNPGNSLEEIISLTVIGPNVYEADRFATAAFAMEQEGINFIEKTKGLEGYAIDKNGVATMTSGFEKYVYD